MDANFTFLCVSVHAVELRSIFSGYRLRLWINLVFLVLLHDADVLFLNHRVSVFMVGILKSRVIILVRSY